MIGYQSQVIPAILAAFTLVYLEKFFRKITPAVISMIVVPFCSLVLAVIAAHFVLGPIGWKIGSAISSVVFAGITGSFRIVFGAVFGFIYAPLVITGLHHMSNAIDLQLIADYGGTMLWPMIALSNIAQGSAVLAMIFLQRKNAEAQEVNIPSCISCYLSVTEPAIFGVNLKYVFPFVCGMIGSAIAGMVSVATGTTASAIGVGGLPGILSIKTESMASFAICMVIAIVIPFVLTVIVGQRKLTASQKYGAAAGADATVNGSAQGTEKEMPKELVAFLDGKVIPVKEVGDGVFSEGIMGDGIAIIPENEVLVSPVAGEIAVTMDDSRHACAIKADNGMEILLHIGLDTVDMGGDGFEYLITKGQRVQTGTPLIRFSREKIKAAGHRDVTMCILSDPGKAENIRYQFTDYAKAGETVVATFE